MTVAEHVAVGVEQAVHVADVAGAEPAGEHGRVAVEAVAAAEPGVVGDVAGALLEVAHQPAPLEHLGEDVRRLLAGQVDAAELGDRVVAVLDEHLLVERPRPARRPTVASIVWSPRDVEVADELVEEQPAQALRAAAVAGEQRALHDLGQVDQGEHRPVEVREVPPQHVGFLRGELLGDVGSHGRRSYGRHRPPGDADSVACDRPLSSADDLGPKAIQWRSTILPSCSPASSRAERGRVLGERRAPGRCARRGRSCDERRHLGELLVAAHRRADDLVLLEEQPGQVELDLRARRAAADDQPPARLERPHGPCPTSPRRRSRRRRRPATGQRSSAESIAADGAHRQRLARAWPRCGSWPRPRHRGAGRCASAAHDTPEPMPTTSTVCPAAQPGPAQHPVGGQRGQRVGRALLPRPPGRARRRRCGPGRRRTWRGRPTCARRRSRSRGPSGCRCRGRRCRRPARRPG